jgi:hypothetical protein
MYQQPRQVKLKTKIELLKHRPFQSLLGIYLIGFTALFITVGLSLTLSFMDRTVPNVNYEEVNEIGKLTTGQITDIDVQEKITDNGEHPAVISYKYRADGQEVEAKYQILAPDKVARMEVGDDIDIKYLEGESIINGFESYSFPAWIFALVPIPFLIIGLVLFIPSITKFRRDLALYQYGKIGEAELVSMTPKSGFALSNFGQRILVYYRYKTLTGQNILGESLTTDFSIINEKKQGDAIKIFLSGQDDSKSCLIPKLEAMRNDWRIEGVDK